MEVFFHHILHFHQRNHFSTHLCEPLEPACMPEIAVFIQVAHIACVVPAVFQDLSRLCGIIIVASHDGRSLDKYLADLPDLALFS